MGVPKEEQYIDTLELSEAQRQEACVIVDKIFDRFTLFMDELLVYAEKSILTALCT